MPAEELEQRLAKLEKALTEIDTAWAITCISNEIHNSQGNST